MVSQRVQAVVVAVFVLLIGGVVVVLLSRTDTEPPPTTSSASPDPGDDPGSAARDPIGPIGLAMGKGDIVLRTMAGSCSEPGGPRLELSKNTGRSFQRIRVPQVDDGSGVSATSPAVRAIVYAHATSPAAITVGAADSECTVHPYVTDDGGGSWRQEPGPLEEWHLDPATGGVVSPTGPTDSGCKTLVAFAPASKSTAKAFCKSGTVRGTRNGGTTWTSFGKLSDVTASVFTSAATGYALVLEDDCRSRVHATANGGRTWTPVGCVAEEFVIVGFTGDDDRLTAGGSGGVRLSTNGGRTWKPPASR